MQQIFPNPIDHVDPVVLYRSDEREPVDERPWVMCNMISSADGGIAVDGTSGGLGSDGDKSVYNALRSIPDVVVVASGTVIAEDYGPAQLSEELQSERRSLGQRQLPRIAVVTGSLSIDPGHRVFAAETDPLVITTESSDEGRRAALGSVAELVLAGVENVDLRDAMAQLWKMGARTVLLEGGPSLNGAFIDADLVDELCLTIAPFVLGGQSPRIVNRSVNGSLRKLELVRTLHEDDYLFQRYLRRR